MASKIPIFFERCFGMQNYWNFVLENGMFVGKNFFGRKVLFRKGRSIGKRALILGIFF